MDVPSSPRTARALVSAAFVLACAVAVPLGAQKKQTTTRVPERPRVTSREVPSLRGIQPWRRQQGSQDRESFARGGLAGAHRPDAENGPRVPREHRLRRADSFEGDLRSLPQTRPPRSERPERDGPAPNPVQLEAGPGAP